MATHQVQPERTYQALATTYVQNMVADMALEAWNGLTADELGIRMHTDLCHAIERALPVIMDNVVTEDAQTIALTAVLHHATSQAAEWHMHEWCAENIIAAVHNQVRARMAL
jgi:hypothetical protein